MGLREDKLIDVNNIPDFWSQVSSAENRLLALDYDGTLASFKIDPMQAYPLPGIRSVLSTLNRVPNTRVAVISGRPVSELLALLGVAGITLIGCHGHEIMSRDGSITVIRPNERQTEGLERAAGAAIRHGFMGRLEKKIGSIAFHTRGVPRQVAMTIEALIFKEWSELAPFELRCRQFNGGVEINCMGRNKADALHGLLADLPQDTLPIYIGDDATDEDVFRMLRERGIGIKVGSPSSATSAKGFLPDCQAVSAFLNAWQSFVGLEGSKGEDGNQEACSRLKSAADRLN